MYELDPIGLGPGSSVPRPCSSHVPDPSPTGEVGSGSSGHRRGRWTVEV